MDVTTTQMKRCDIVRVEGRIDSYTAPEVEEALKALLEKGRYRIVLDMGGVDFMSSKGWWVLIEAQKACRKYNRGEVVLVDLQEKLQESLNLVGMGSYFKVFDNVTEAVGSF